MHACELSPPPESSWVGDPSGVCGFSVSMLSPQLLHAAQVGLRLGRFAGLLVGFGAVRIAFTYFGSRRMACRVVRNRALNVTAMVPDHAPAVACLGIVRIKSRASLQSAMALTGSFLDR